MYEGNPWEIDFGSTKRRVRVSEGSSCRESTVYLICNHQWGIRLTPLPNKVYILSQKRLIKAPYYVKGYT